MPDRIAGKTLKSSALQATTPAWKRMKSEAPRGKQAHRTYKGNLVAPGFLSRSIKRKSSYRNGRAKVTLGVKKEAFYGLVFVERGTRPHRIPKRGSAALKFGGAVWSHVNHPGARAKPWFEPSFRQSRHAMVARLAKILRKKIELAAKR